MEHKFDFLVFIGRFQPLHRGHLSLIREALKQTEKLIILVGSSYQPRTTKNPWLFEERVMMIISSLTPEEVERVIINPVMDVMYNDDIWVQNIKATVKGITLHQHHSYHREAKIGLIGHHKDDSSYYLDLFPEWEYIEVGTQEESMSATPIREKLFDNPEGYKSIDPLLPNATFEIVKNFVENEVYRDLAKEHTFIKGYKEAWKDAPYDPTFNTADSLVVCKDHVLLITRNNHPGKGLLAMPGGFVDTGETLFGASLRELLEETNIDVTQAELKLSLVNEQIFDHPDRSLRGRTITNVFHYDLGREGELPKIKASDDAAKAEWHPIRNLKPQVMFEDHYHIIRNMLNPVKLAS